MTAPACSFTFIGNAAALLRFGPFTLLTDPNFLHRGQLAYLGKGLLSRRLKDPALGIDELPPLDAIVLSHMHGDHWDRVARKGLDRQTPVFTTPKAARALRRQRFGNSAGLPTWHTETLTKDGHALSVTAMPGRHARGAVRALLPPVMGSLLEYSPAAGPTVRVYITGDTLLVDDLREIPRRVGGLDVAVVHLGGTTLPGGLVVTMDGREGAELVELVRPTTAIPVHYDDYGRFRSPLADFRREMARRGLAEVVRVVERGETAELGAHRAGADGADRASRGRGRPRDMSREKPEPDVDADEERVDSRATGGVPDPDKPDQGSTTGTTPDGEYVGRVAGQDTGYAEETGAERRAEG